MTESRGEDRTPDRPGGANFYATLRRHFAHALERDQPALEKSDGRSVTYRDLDRLSALFAAGLRGRGLEPGDRVVVQVDKSVEALALYLGVLRSGGVYVPLNVAYTEHELEFFIGDTRPRVLVGRPDDREALERVAAAGSVEVVEILGAASDFAHDVADLVSSDSAVDPDGVVEGEGRIEARSATDLAGIFYTSGTTGRSKGAMLTHACLEANARALHELWGFRDGDVLLHALPIFHIHGLFVALHTALLNASRVLFLDRFDAATVRDRLREATVFMGVPTFYHRLLALGSGDGDGGPLTRSHAESMRLFTSGSAPLPESVFEEFEARTGHRILERYGMTEVGIVLSNPLEGERVPGTVGFPVGDTRVRVCDKKGRELDPGEVGVLEVRGSSLFAGYWRLPEKTAEEFRGDGFFVTGDLASMAPDGRVSIVGRAKDLVISGGYNIYPREIEDCLLTVDGVDEAAVVGVPHEDLGEGVVAVLVSKSGASIETAVLEERLIEDLARFKHPRRFFWVDDLPRNAMGKVQKTVLQERYRDLYRGG